MRAAFIVLVAATPAWAGPLADRARDAFDNVDYAQAAHLMTRALAEEGFDAPSLLRAYLLLGTARLALGEEADAAGAFATLYALDPALRPDPDSSPKLLEALRRAARAGAPPPGIVHHPPANFSGDVVRLDAEVTAAPRLQAIVEYRAGGQRRARARLDCEGARCRAIVAVGGAAQLEYRLALETPEGALALPTPTVLLDRVAPLAAMTLPAGARATTPPPAIAALAPAAHDSPPRRDRRRVWIWSSVAVVAVAAVAVGLGVGLSTRTFPNEPVVSLAR